MQVGDAWHYSVSHELGHQVFYQLQGNSADVLTGSLGPHSPATETDDSLAFIEGFADFIMAITSVPEYLHDADTSIPGNYESNSWWMGKSGANTSGNNVEGSVGSILLDIFDDDNVPRNPLVNPLPDDDKVQDPDFFLQLIFDIISMNNGGPTSQKINKLQEFYDFMYDSAATKYWWDTATGAPFMGRKGTICREIFASQNFLCSVPGPVSEYGRRMSEYSASANFCLCPNDAIDQTTGVAEDQEEEPVLPLVFTVLQNFPNPFNAETRIGFIAPIRGDYQFEVINILGQRLLVRQLKVEQPGEYWIDLDGRSTAGLASGVYFYRIISTSSSISKKMLYLK